MAIFQGFIRFLKEYHVIAISVAFIIGMTALNFIHSFVNDVALPIIRPIISRGSIVWEDMIFSIGPVNLRIGSFLSASLNLLIVTLFLYIFIDKIMRWKPKKR